MDFRFLVTPFLPFQTMFSQTKLMCLCLLSQFSRHLGLGHVRLRLFSLLFLLSCDIPWMGSCRLRRSGEGGSIINDRDISSSRKRKLTHRNRMRRSRFVISLLVFRFSFIFTNFSESFIFSFWFTASSAWTLSGKPASSLPLPWGVLILILFLFIGT